ncbi:MAG: flavodoxin family protein [Methanomassiliicoccus sp.]|nr:flavodoxin family protein [Methanomassiliicoccus sp.]
MRSILVLRSYHHRNTEKIAKVFAEVLDARIVEPQDTGLEELGQCDLIGFGSGIYDGKHHVDLLKLADRMPSSDNKKVFLFSTSWDKRIDLIHSQLRKRLVPKGYIIIDEFNCGGFNTNSFLKYFGGLNKGRPNAEDLKRAQVFAQGLKGKMGTQ